MSGEHRSEIERRDEWALTHLDAAAGLVGATVGATVGPLGSILAALIGPYGKRVAARLMGLRTRVAEEVDDEELLRRLEESEPLAQMMAEVVRGTVESDLEAKRRLLARAAIHALKDDAIVDEERVFVRACNALDTLDVRVLVSIAAHGDDVMAHGGEDVRLPFAEIERRTTPGTAAATTSTLASVGMIESPATIGGEVLYQLTTFGRALLDRLLEEGLEDELRRRSGEEESA
jgi:hypothetical protein